MRHTYSPFLCRHSATQDTKAGSRSRHIYICASLEMMHVSLKKINKSRLQNEVDAVARACMYSLLLCSDVLPCRYFQREKEQGFRVFRRCIFLCWRARRSHPVGFTRSVCLHRPTYASYHIIKHTLPLSATNGHTACI